MFRARLVRRGADGGASAVEFALLTPILILIIFAVVQFAMYFFARQVAESAAQAGARTARAEADRQPGGWQEPAEQRARRQIDGLGSQMVEAPKVSTVRSGNQVGVRVVAGTPRLLPFAPTINVVSRGPIERFVPDTP